MAFAGNTVYAERRRDNEIDEHHIRPIRRSVESATAKPSDKKGKEKEQPQNFQEQTEKLLACPCLDDLKQGPCGDSFKDAFRCFILSQQPEKGAECAQEFSNLEACVWKHSEMFAQLTGTTVKKIIPKIPEVPVNNLSFNQKIAEWKDTK